MNNTFSAMVKNIAAFSGFIGCAVIIALLLLCCALTFVVYGFTSMPQGFVEKTYTSETLEDNGVMEKIFIIDVEGVVADVEDGIYNSSVVDYILSSLDDAQKDQDVIGVILRMNTPGGTVYDTGLIADKISELQAGEKPVVTIMEDIVASGGYWIAAQTDYIYANPQTITGSIGVLLQTVEYDELFKKVGLEEVIITNTAGKNKAPRNLNDPETEGYKIYKAMLDDTYEEFIKVILAGRKLNRLELEPIADGRVLSAGQAKQYKLIDAYGGLEEAKQYIQERTGKELFDVIELKRSELIGFSSFSSKVKVLLTKVDDPLAKTGIVVYALPEEFFN